VLKVDQGQVLEITEHGEGKSEVLEAVGSWVIESDRCLNAK
jgi:phosphotransferase system HPr-like phosphotransfer protein